MAWTYKGASLGELGQYQEALFCQKKALALDPESHIAWLCNKGDALENLGRYSEAIEAYRKSLKFAKPESAGQVKEIEQAIQNLERVTGVT